MPPELQCPSCKSKITESDFFCPSCGKKLKDKPLSTDLMKQIGLYLFSFLLPPLGLFPAFKYLKQPDQKSKYVGITAIVLTVFSIVFSIVFGNYVINKYVSEFDDQIKMYQDLGI